MESLPLPAEDQRVRHEDGDSSNRVEEGHEASQKFAAIQAAASDLREDDANPAAQLLEGAARQGDRVLGSQVDEGLFVKSFVVTARWLILYLRISLTSTLPVWGLLA